MKVRRMFAVSMFVASMLLGAVVSVGAAPSANHCLAQRGSVRWSVPAAQRYSTFKDAQIGRADLDSSDGTCAPAAVAPARKARMSYAEFKDLQAGN
jgi:hypothetical protein